jgi:O-antigen/teichoic acid export membrane protein
MTGVVLLIAIVRRGGTSAAGYYGIATLIGTVAAFSFSLGLGTYCTRSYAAGDITGEEVAVIHRIRGLGVLVSAALLAGGAAFVAGTVRVGFVLTAASVLIDQWNETGWAICRGQGRARVEATADLGSNVGILLVAVGAIGLTRGLPFDVAGALLVASAVGRSVIALGLVRTFPKIPWSESTAVVRRHLRAALPYCASDVLGLAYLRGDTLLLAMFATSSVVGSYVAANSMIGPLVQVAAIMGLGSLALMARNRSRGTTQARDETTLVAVFGAAGSLVAGSLAIGLWLTTGILFPSHAQAIRQLAVILALFLPLRFVNFALSAILLARGDAKRRLWIVGVSTLLNVVLNLVFDPRLGAYGAAWGTVITEVGVTWLFVRSLSSRRLSQPILATGGTVAAASMWVSVALHARQGAAALVVPTSAVLFGGCVACVLLARRTLRQPVPAVVPAMVKEAA